MVVANTLHTAQFTTMANRMAIIRAIGIGSACSRPFSGCVSTPHLCHGDDAPKIHHNYQGIPGLLVVKNFLNPKEQGDVATDLASFFVLLRHQASAVNKAATRAEIPQPVRSRQHNLPSSEYFQPLTVHFQGASIMSEYFAKYGMAFHMISSRPRIPGLTQCWFLTRGCWT